MVHFFDRHAELAGNRRQKRCISPYSHRLHDLGSKYLQRTAECRLHAGRVRNDPVGNRRRQSAAEERILSILAPSRDNVGVLRSASSIIPGMSRGSFCRSPEVTSVAARVGEPCRERGGLTEVASKPDHSQARIPRLNLQQLERVVGAAVVDRQNLASVAQRTRERRSAPGGDRQRWGLRCAAG